MKKFCITTVVSKWYQDYAPLFTYCINKAYPEVDVIILCREKFSDLNKEKMSCLSNWKVIEDQFGMYPNKENYTKILRFLYCSKELMDYEYAYMADVDMMIAREEPSLLDQHIEHMDKIDLPYSNGVRRNADRLTGLQCVRVDDYFNLVALPAARNFKKFKDDSLGNINAELSLYKIFEEEEIPLPPRAGEPNHFRPHHGIHLGIFRVFFTSKKAIEYVRKAVKNPDYPGHYEEILKYRDDLLYKKMIEGSNAAIQKQVKLMHQIFDGKDVTL